jgi:DNA-directed RNA polymerase specialized sigma24 family protein/outer membrane biosynthesis protein TonB
MDLGRDAIDYDEIIQRYGRRLFVLAYHLTGTPAEAEELCRECLVRSLLAPDFPATDKDAGVFLHRGLISLWRERAATGGSAVDIAPENHASLFQALSRLDPVSRAVLVLRVAEGLEYETIGKVLDMAPDVVYARLLQARGGLREGERALESSLFETMNLYLDDRLPPDRRGVFERRIQIDAALRERVEFHRGLTLELHEEAPPLPRDFIPRLRERLERTLETLLLVDRATEAVVLETGSGPAAPGRVPAPAERRLSPWVFAAGALVLLIAGVALGLWISRRGPLGAPQPGQPVDAARPATTPDEATTEALRSLGYLAPGKDKSKGTKPGKATPTPTRVPAPARTPKPAPAPATGARRPSPSRTPAPRPAPVAPAATPSPAPTESAPAAAPSPAPPAETPPREAEVAWRVIPITMEPGTETDPRVLRTAAEWAALFAGAGTPPPEVVFERDMVVLLPARLALESVTIAGEALLIACHREQVDPDAGPASAAGIRLAVVVPISALPVRLVVR